MIILSQEVLIPEERTAGVGGDFLSLKGNTGSGRRRLFTAWWGRPWLQPPTAGNRQSAEFCCPLCPEQGPGRKSCFSAAPTSCDLGVQSVQR